MTLGGIVADAQTKTTHHAVTASIIPFLGYIKNTYTSTSEKINFILDKLIGMYNWFSHLNDHISQMSINLLGFVYKMLSGYVLYTPIWVFDNSWFRDSVLTFSSISFIIVILLTMVEGIKRMLKRKHTDLKTIIGRLPFAVIGSGFTPIAFTMIFKCLNKVSRAITNIGFDGITSTGVSTFAKTSGIDTVALLGFDIALIIMLLPVVLYTGRRWFDLLCLGAITPLSLAANCFDAYKHHHKRWWDNVRHLSLIQLVYAVFICLMGLFIFGTSGITSEKALMVKLLVIMGGVWRMANPPQFILRMTDHGKDSLDAFNELKDILTMKKFKPAQFVKSKIAEHKQKPEMIKALRKKLGRRYVK